MATKTTGVEWKRYYSDKTAWPDGCWHENEEFIVDGLEWVWDKEMMAIDDAAVISISGGIVYLNQDDTQGPTVEAHFKRWRKMQNTVFFSCEAPRGCAKTVRAAILAAGGRAHAL